MPSNEGPYDMLIYCGTNMRRYRLPFTMDTNYSVYAPTADTDLKKDMCLNLAAKGGNWYIANTENMLIPGEVMLVTIQNVKIKLHLRVLNDSITKYGKYDISRCQSIYITDQDGKIRVTRDAAASHIAIITILGNKATIKPDKSNNVFHNGKGIVREQDLNIKDNLYVGEICFVYLGSVLAINHLESVNCGLPAYSKKTQNETKKDMGEDPAYTLKSFDFQRSAQVRMILTPQKEEIEVPPPQKPHNATPFWLQAGASLSMFIVMAASLIVRVTLGASNQIMVVVSTFSLVGSMSGMVLFPRLMRKHQADKARKEEQERCEKYGTYLRNKDKILAIHKEKDIGMLKKRYPSADDLLKNIIEIARVLWGRTPVFQEFLDIRIGTGSRPALHYTDIVKEGFALNEDPCRVEADTVVNKYQDIEDAPISVELSKNPVVGIYGHRETCLALLRSILVQITAMHSYDDVKIILLYDSDSEFMSFARWFPHMWNHDRTFRYVAKTKNEVDNILGNLKPVFDDREEKKEKQKIKDEVFIPHFVVISLSPALLKNEMLHRSFLSNYDDLNGMGISFIVVDKNLSGLPMLSDTFIDCQNSREAFINRNDGLSRGMMAFVPDLLPNDSWTPSTAPRKYWWNPPVDWPSLARHMYRIKTMDTSENSLLPHSLSFMGMYEAKTLDDLGIERRWDQNNNARYIQAPVGISATSIFNLDIHEKGHGPHGLIAGTTGSGKSEFIQTLILSLCVNYSPDDIAFIIIDYKGGSTANIFKTLPHLAGCITNLGGNQIKRSLLSITSEKTKRQHLMATCGDASVNDIDKYNELRKNNPSLPRMPHLILIADEFAELKHEQLEFMEEIISVSRTGRSLGIHLLLATQKPSGVVNEQILSNTRFRICLKVADKNDSNEMLKKPDAADITQVGRAYVQVGNNEIYQQIQTGYSGTPFLGDKNAGTELAEIFYIQHNGQINHNLSAREKEYEGRDVTKIIPSQLEAVLGHINTLSKDRYQPYQLWLAPLPEMVHIDELRSREDFPPCFKNGKWNRFVKDKHYNWMVPVVGLIDDVRKQEQPLLALDFAENGHLALYGIKGSGKTTFLHTLVYALVTQYTPEDVHIYIVDYDMGTFIAYKDQLPHVGSVILPDDEQRLAPLFNYLEEQTAKRRKLMAEAGTSTIKLYNAKREAKKESKLPAIMVIIHNFEAFAEEQGVYREKVRELIRDSDKAGIYFVLTGSSRAALPSSMQRHIKSFICMQMLDRFDYKQALNVKDDLQPEQVSGRGLIKMCGNAMEFQTATVIKFDENGQPDDSALISLYGEIKSAWTGTLPYILGTIPDPYIFKQSLSEDTYQNILKNGNLPLGYDKSTNALISLRVQDINIFPIIGGRKKGKTNMLKCLAELCANVPNEGLYIFDSADKHLQVTAEELNLAGTYAHNKETVDSLGRQLFAKGMERKNAYDGNKGVEMAPLFILIDDIIHFYGLADAETVKTIDGLMSVCEKYGVHFFVTGARIDALRGSTKIYDRMFEYDNGILLGGNLDEYNYFKADVRYSKERSNQFPEGTGYIFDKGNFSIIKTPKYDRRSR